MLRKAIITLTVTCSALLLLLAGYLWLVYPQTPIVLQQQKLFQVTKGSGFNQLCRQLQSEQIIEYCAPLKWFSTFSSDLRIIKAGLYQIIPGISHRQLLEQLSEGREYQFSITFVEGERLTQILAKLADSQYLVNDIGDPQTLPERLNSDESSLEGMLFPDTYHYSAGSGGFAIVARAYEKMQIELAQLWQNRAMELPYNSPYEALIMASIIEKETAQAAERRLIAAVFINRLKKKMRLQTDPTVIYGLGESFDGNITRAHLKQHTPYNTYRISGLPPTPIAMPGRAAIAAALDPEQSDYLYFVAKKDGTHQFSTTLKDHNQAVKKYQLGGQNDQ